MNSGRTSYWEAERVTYVRNPDYVGPRTIDPKDLIQMSTTSKYDLSYTTALYYCLGRRDVGADVTTSTDDIHRFAGLYATLRTSDRGFVPSVQGAWSSYTSARSLEGVSPLDVDVEHLCL